jgi:hypothetical protein
MEPLAKPRRPRAPSSTLQLRPITVFTLFELIQRGDYQTRKKSLRFGGLFTYVATQRYAR